MSKARELADFVAAGNPLADGSITFDEIADGNLTITSGTIKLDGNYPTGSSNTALGNGALNDTLTGQQNTAIGSASLAALTSGNDNTAVGRVSLSNNTTGGQNTAVGRYALSASTTGSSNTALGAQALNSNTTASNNTAVGYQAGYTTATGDSNTFVGEDSGYSTVGNRNTFVGREAGRASNLAATQQNTFVGCFSGRYVTSGAKNTIIGGYDGNQGGLDIRTSSNNIVLSDGDGNPRQVINNSGAVGYAGANYGTAGQVLTSGGSGAAPTWADASGGAFVLIDEVNASSSDTVELTGMDSTYKTYMIVGSDLVMSSGQDLTFTLKQGGSYVTSGYYAAIYNQYSGNNAGGFTVYENQANQQFTKNNNPNSNFIMYIYNPSNASTRTAYKVLHTGTASGTAYTTTTDGMQNTAGAVTDIKFDASNKTYTSGNFKLYGIGG